MKFRWSFFLVSMLAGCSAMGDLFNGGDSAEEDTADTGEEVVDSATLKVGLHVGDIAEDNEAYGVSCFRATSEEGESYYSESCNEGLRLFTGEEGGKTYLIDQIGSGNYGGVPGVVLQDGRVAVLPEPQEELEEDWSVVAPGPFRVFLEPGDVATYLFKANLWVGSAFSCHTDTWVYDPEQPENKGMQRDVEKAQPDGEIRLYDGYRLEHSMSENFFGVLNAGEELHVDGRDFRLEGAESSPYGRELQAWEYNESAMMVETAYVDIMVIRMTCSAL